MKNGKMNIHIIPNIVINNQPASCRYEINNRSIKLSNNYTIPKTSKYSNIWAWKSQIMLIGPSWPINITFEPNDKNKCYWASCDPITCLRDPQWLLCDIGPQWPVSIASKVQINQMRNGPTCPSYTQQP